MKFINDRLPLFESYEEYQQFKDYIENYNASHLRSRGSNFNEAQNNGLGIAESN